MIFNKKRKTGTGMEEPQGESSGLDENSSTKGDFVKGT